MTAYDRTMSGGKGNNSQPGSLTTINFRQDTLFAVERDDGVYVAVKPMCDSLGLAWQRQLERIKADPVLSEGVTLVVIPSPGGAQETTCLKLELINGWLFKIDSRRVKEEVKPRLLSYQRDCYQVLFDAFYGKRNQPEMLPEAEETTDNENLKLRHITECRQTFGSTAAAQLWFKLNLPIVPAMLQDPRQMSLWEYGSVKSLQGTA